MGEFILLYFGLGVLLGLALLVLGIKQNRRWLTALGAAISCLPCWWICHRAHGIWAGNPGVCHRADVATIKSGFVGDVRFRS